MNGRLGSVLWLAFSKYVQSESAHRYNLQTYWMTFCLLYFSIGMGERRMLSFSQPIWTSLDQIWPVKYHVTIQLNHYNTPSWNSLYCIHHKKPYHIHYTHIYTQILLCIHTISILHMGIWCIHLSKIVLAHVLYNRLCETMKRVERQICSLPSLGLQLKSEQRYLIASAFV